MVGRRNRPAPALGRVFRVTLPGDRPPLHQGGRRTPVLQRWAALCLVLAACPTPPALETDPPPPPTPPEPTYTVESSPLDCADPEARSTGTWDIVPLDLPPPAREYLWAAAAAVGDVDGDDRPDVIALADTGPVLFRNPHWQPEALGDHALPMAVALADVDADGDLDLFVARYQGPDALLRNDGTGAFVEDGQALQGNAPGHSGVVSLADVDSDGDLDALVLSTGEAIDDEDVLVRHFPPSGPAQLWINRGDGVFDDRGDTLPGSVHQGFSLAGGLHDLDADGRMDLYAVNDFGSAHGANVWLVGDGAGGFAEPPAGHGLSIVTTGMGLALGDINGDAIEDMAIAYWGGVRVHESFASEGLVAWYNRTDLRIPNPVPSTRIAWGGDFADVDNDGDLDLYVSFGHLEFADRWPNARIQSDRLYLSEPGVEAWTDATAAWGLDEGAVTRGTVLADLDDDGWLDLVRPSQDQPAILMARCGEARGLRIRLRTDGPNRRAIGARVVLHGPTGDVLRVVRAGGTNYGSAGPAEVHFGLGTEQTADVTITWPDGTVSTHADLPAASKVTLVRTDPPRTDAP